MIYPYNFILYGVIFVSVFLIGIPTIYAMLFGAPWVPTPILAVRRMVIEANLKKGKKIYDLGCGDGRLLIESTKKGATAVGYEISPLVYIAGFLRCLFYPNATILLKSFWREDISDADVVFFYLLPKSIKSLLEKFRKELKKGTLIISYAFEIKDLKPIKKIERDRARGLCPIWVYKI